MENQENRAPENRAPWKIGHHKNSLPMRQNNEKWLVIDKNIIPLVLNSEIEFCDALCKVNRNDFTYIINCSSTRLQYSTILNTICRGLSINFYGTITIINSISTFQ